MTNKIVYCRNIGLSYKVNDTRLSPFRYHSMPIEAIAPIWYMGVAKCVGVVVNIVSAVLSFVSVVVLMVVEDVLRADQTLLSYQCRTAVVLRSYRQSWTDKDREVRPRCDGLVTIMTDRGGIL